MRNSFLLFSISILMILNSQVQAGQSDTSTPIETNLEISRALCPDFVTAFENIQVQQMRSQNGNCFLSLHPRDAFETMIYRDYLLSTSGLFMVFNSFAPEESPETTGAREFFFFPKEFKGYQLKIQDSSLIVSGFQSMEMRFSLKTAQITSMTQGSIEVKPEVDPANEGGVEIISFNGLYLDAGFSLGESPSAKPNRSSTWKNPFQQACTLNNNENFKYKRGEPTLKSPSEIALALRRSCPDFRLP